MNTQTTNKLLSVAFAFGVALAFTGTDALACSPGDLIISKQGPATAHVGDTITYTVKPEQAIKKNKTGSVNITVKDILPAGLTVLSADLVPLGNSWSQDTIDNHGAPECVVNGSTVQCHLPILGQPDKNNHVTEALITIKAKVEQELACTTIKNQATIAGERDKNTSNNISEWVTTEITGSCVTTTPTPTPTPENKPGIHVTKTDNHDVTRPGHDLTYTIEVENTGDVDLQDIKIVDEVPSQLEHVRSISSNGELDGHQVIWSNVELNVGEKKHFTFTATVKTTVANGTKLLNTVSACSKDHDVCDNGDDTTKVEKQPKVAGIVKTVVIKPVPVPISAKTGAAGMLTLVSTLMSGSGLTYLIRKGR